jgi:hypothetical protein
MQVFVAILGVITVGDQAVHKLVTINPAERAFRCLWNIPKIGIGLVAAFLQILLVLILAQIVILRGAGNPAVP